MIHLGCSLVLTVIKIAVTVQLLRSSGLAARTMGSAASLSITFTTYWIIIGAVYGIDAVRAAGEARIRTARLEAELANARLEVLTARLHPHFLFNCLHSIAELMHRDVDAADLAIERVAELLRAALDTSKSREIALRDELALIDRYVSIERIRFEDRLRICYEAAPETLDATVPVLLLGVPLGGHTFGFRYVPRTWT